MGAELAQFGLTPLQERFVLLYCNTGDKIGSVREAGYSGMNSDASAGGRAWSLLRTPAIQAAIRFQTAVQLQSAAPLAVKVLTDILRDETAPRGVRLDASKTVLDRIGFVPPKARDPDRAGEGMLNEISQGELERLVAEWRKRGDEAKLIAPPSGAESVQVTDMLD